jgi:Anti-sigma-K factor rskA
MTKRPDFDELVGGELQGAERDRLQRVHELLVAAGPPPELVPAEPPVPVASVTPIRARRRGLALVALAAALAVAVFGAGYFVGNRGGSAERVVAMVGTPQATEASASLDIFAVDEAGNWPMKLEVAGLFPTPDGHAYELWLTKDGRLAALCGSFRADSDGTTQVPMNAPYKLTDFDGWVVVAEGSKTPLLTTA